MTGVSLNSAPAEGMWQPTEGVWQKDLETTLQLQIITPSLKQHAKELLAQGEANGYSNANLKERLTKKFSLSPINPQNKSETSSLLWTVVKAAGIGLGIAALVALYLQGRPPLETNQEVVERCFKVLASPQQMHHLELEKSQSACMKEMPDAFEMILLQKQNLADITENECLSWIKLFEPVKEMKEFAPHRLGLLGRCAIWTKDVGINPSRINTSVSQIKLLEHYPDTEEACSLAHRFLPELPNSSPPSNAINYLRTVGHAYYQKKHIYDNWGCENTSVGKEMLESLTQAETYIHNLD